MGENGKSGDAPKKRWIVGLKAEFKRIIWPDTQTVLKQTLAVIAVSVLLSVMIAIIDAVVQLGLRFIL
jgi:preprotein translocase subunit SecE